MKSKHSEHGKLRGIRLILASFALVLSVLFTGCGLRNTAQTAQPSSVVQIAQEADSGEQTTADSGKVTASGGVNQAASGQTEAQTADAGTAAGSESTASVSEDGEYTSKDEVALYIHLYGHLPDNYITKSEAKALGWDSRSGNLYEVAPGKSIGGDRFGNYEGNLPEADGRVYRECDIDYTGGYRNSKRIVYSSDGLIYYTEDHYNTFELLYGEE
ncbi:MAG: ribonuclease domain-containing protein [Lachnospiraceae bacterium]|jgi:ribonuclease T1